jgi:hypothetical protein
MRNLGFCVVLVAGCGSASRTPVGTTAGGMKQDMGATGSTTSGGGADLAGTSNPTGMTFNDMCNGKPTTISGVVTAPNGHDPIPNAFAYVINSRGEFPPTVACELCNMPVDSVSATTTTKVDGSFTLDISTEPVSATLEVTVNMGRFRHTGTVSVQPCMDNSDADTALPGKAGGTDDIPKIAVATGNQDELDTVLEAMGLDSTVGFDCYEGREPPAAGKTLKALTTPCGKRASLSPIESLLGNETMLESYNLVFLSCAPYKFKSLTAAQQQQITANLQTWTGKGGRLFVTDNSYDYIAQAFPAAISFLDGNTAIDAANEGVGGTSSAPASYAGIINDMTLASWMSTVGAIPSGSNTLTLNGYLSHWSVVGSLPMSTTDVVDATNAVAYGTGPKPSPTPGPAATYPQSVKFDIDAPSGGACGRGIYTSYHTLLSTTSSVDPTVMLSPQERILEYLMFEAGACVGPIS